MTDERSFRDRGRRAAERGARCQLLADEAARWTEPQKLEWFDGYLSVYHVSVVHAVREAGLFSDFCIGQSVDYRVLKIREAMAANT